MKMLIIEAVANKRTRLCRALSKIGCLLANSVFNERTILQVGRMIVMGPINGEYVAILLLLISLPVVSVFN